jgi:phosphoinositide-3-kinase, regulatory subunit 4
MTSTEEAKLVSMRDYVVKLANAISRCGRGLNYAIDYLISRSYSLRQSVDEESDVLKTTAHVELQKLKVVPQTVFLKTRTADLTSRTPRVLPTPRHQTPFEHPRSPRTDTSRLSRPSSVEYGSSGAPFEDLRRRLTAINGSGVSLPSFPHRSSSVSVSSPSQPIGPTLDDLPEVSDRPGSPTDSVLSTPNPPLNRAMHRIHVGGGDGQKAAPAIGSSKANAIGHLEATSKMLHEGSPEHSGRTSPVSTTGTVSGQHWRRPTSLAPISTYGRRTAHKFFHPRYWITE